MTGSEIRAAREQRGWTQQELAARVGRSQATISLIESGKASPSPEVARQLEALLKGGPEAVPGAAARPPADLRLSVPDLTAPSRAMSFPVRFETWQRPQESGDLCLVFPFSDDAILVAAIDVAGHGIGMLPLGVYVAGWLRGWMEGINAPPRLGVIIAELSRELRRTGIDLSCYLGLFSRESRFRHTVTYEAVCHSFPPPLLITGPPFRTEDLPQIGPPLPADTEAPMLRLETLSAPWRLVIATDGLLSRLGNGDEMIGKRWLREWQSGPDRDRPPAEHLDPTAVLSDDELFALLRWTAWDFEASFSSYDDRQRHQTLERIGQSIERAVGREHRYDFEQALIEALDNARQHAYGNGPGAVSLRFRQEEGAFRAEVEDHGPTRLAASRARASGGGFAVMRRLVDDLEIRTPRGGGTIVQLRLARTPEG